MMQYGLGGTRDHRETQRRNGREEVEEKRELGEGESRIGET